MHKDKSGKVYASLTEVKNKTGDIFALVDEFGEVYLTSYNKVRYKISKIEISSTIELNEKAEKQSQPKAVRSEKVTEKPAKKEVKEESKASSTEGKTPKTKTIEDMVAWDRNNSIEEEFTMKVSSPIVGS